MALVQKIRKKCPKCQTVIEGKEVFCPECGVNIKEYNILNTPEPTMSGWTLLGIIFLCILFLPLGIIVGILQFYALSQKRKAWRHQQLMGALQK